ncbi:hypothetical protein M878_00575 [Streptomyces roseochromogenus subsp. oscitans DS 12.976]|uniref:Plasmid replication protein RepL domain-containing protein n=1 Tax=Streptomyces roseochromogenus subsp. oscitans DS 12.976 TaxID=1352936 RepID=V6KX86_STRRC|nr:hypothetical protein M878_00575 [Streptomyces roseochromogenus subsp. oscitans DS 12.976]
MSLQVVSLQRGHNASGMSRAVVNTALRHLDLAQLVKKQRAGVYQINPMLAPYAPRPRTRSPR